MLSVHERRVEVFGAALARSRELDGPLQGSARRRDTRSVETVSRAAAGGVDLDE